MKALIVSDLHLRPTHIEMARKVLSLIESKVDELKPEYLINLGDTFHTKNQIYAIVQNLYQDFLEKMSKKVKIIQLVGNHDWALQYSDHPFKSFKYIPNLVVVDSVYTLGENTFIAYCREKERFNELLKSAGGQTARIFAHMDLNGFTPGSGWEEVSPFFEAEHFSKYEQVISGHLHLAQSKKLASGTEVLFVGSAYTTDFGESDQEKRFLLMDLNTGKYESIPTNLTMHKTLKINAGEAFPEIPEEEVNKGIDYRIKVKGTKEQISSLIIPKKYPAKIVPEVVLTQSARIELSAGDTQEETIKKYITAELERKYGGVEKSGLDIEKLIKMAKKFLPVG